MSDDAQLKSVEEQDREWFENVYKRDMPQLTVRAVISGMVFGGLMSLSNLYIGLKSGWGLGVDIAAVILIFSIFKGLKGAGIVKKDFGMMENTIMMTVAVAASWISSAGLVSAVPALSMLTGYEFVWWQLAIFIGGILYLGLFMAIPLKRQLIQIDKLRFPATIPTGETLKAMYSHGTQAIKKAKALGTAGGIGVLISAVRDIPMLGWIPGLVSIPLSIARVSMSKLTLSLEPSLIFIGIGGLFGMKVGLSMLLGLVLNFGVLAPNLIDAKIIEHPAPQIQAAGQLNAPLTVNPGESISLTLEEANVGPEMKDGSVTNTYTYTWSNPKTYTSNADLIRDFNKETLDNGSANPLFGVISVSDTLSKELGSGARVLFFSAFNSIHWESRLTLDENQPSPQLISALGFEPGQSRMQAVGGFRNISAWSLWPGATMLVVGGLLALAFQWRTLGRTFGSIFASLGKKKDGRKKGILDDIEIPMAWFLPGFIITGILCTVTLMLMFDGVHWYMGVIAVLLTFVLAAVAARAAAEVGINPIGALGKVTQLTFGVISAGNVTANLMTAGVTSGAAASCADTVANLKVGHMVGASPRKQFIAQLFGVLAGALLAVPAYFILVPDVSVLGGDKFPAPSALVWMGVAQVLSKGLSTLPPSIILAMIIAFVFAVVVVILEKIFPKIRAFTPSVTALGIAMVIPAYTSFSMFIGALIVWFMEKKAPETNDMYTIPVASGCIAGESIMGVALAALIAFGIM